MFTLFLNRVDCSIVCPHFAQGFLAILHWTVLGVVRGEEERHLHVNSLDHVGSRTSVDAAGY